MSRKTNSFSSPPGALQSCIRSVVLWVLLPLLLLGGVARALFQAVRHPETTHFLAAGALVTATVLLLVVRARASFASRLFHCGQSVLLLGLSFRLLLFTAQAFDAPRPTGDWAKYEQLAKRLAFEMKYYDYTTPNGIELRSYRPPGLPLLITPVYWLLGDSPWAPRLIMLLASLGGLLLAFALHKRIQSPLSFVVLAYIALAPNVLCMSTFTNSQNLMLPLLLGLILVVRSNLSAPIQASLAGCLVGAGSLIRAETIFFCPLLLLCYFGRLRSTPRASIRVMVLFLMFVAVLVLPWTLRNYVVLNRFVLISSNLGSVLYSASVISDPAYGGGYNGIPNTLYEQDSSPNEVRLSKNLTRATLLYIQSHLSQYLKSIPYRISRYMAMQTWATIYTLRSLRTDVPMFIQELFFFVDRAMTWLLVLLGLRSLYRKSRLSWPSLVLLSVYSLWTLLSLFFFESIERNHFPSILFPLVAVIIGAHETVVGVRFAVSTCHISKSDTNNNYSI